ncbi:inaD-like protein, partial [Sander vitreus]
MVIRSVVPSSSADRHGALLPGDQLVSVNQTQLDSLSLDEAVEVLRTAPPGTVRLGLRKPLVAVEETERISQVSLSHTQLPVPKGFGDGSILPDDLHHREEEEEEEEPELILDGGLPRYTSSSLTSDLWPAEEGTEMAVDEEEEEEEKEGERKAPPSWEEWKLNSSSQRGAEESWSREQQQLEDEDLQRSDQESIASLGNLIPDFRDSEADSDLTLTDTDTESVSSSFSFSSSSSSSSELQHLFTSCIYDLTSKVKVQNDQFRDSEADSDLTLTDTDTESVRMIGTARPKRRSQGGACVPIRRDQGDLPEREDGEGEETPAFSHWGPPRRVEVWPEDGQSLGLSIVGGHHVIKRLRNGEELKGIFIKQVLRNSPAAKTRCLKTGDKILEVSGVDLRVASHEDAVNAIKSAPSPVVFIVQSLMPTPRPVSLTAASHNKHKETRTKSPTAGAAPPPLRQPPPYRPPNQSEQELKSDLEQAKERWCERYGELQGELLCVELEKERQGLGLSLAGNRDRSRLSIFVVGLHPAGPAARDGRIRVGDELLEINSQVLYGRSHQNASAIIKSAAAKVKLILL